MRKFRANGFIKGTSLAEIMAHRFHSRAQLPGRADEARDAALISSFLFYSIFFACFFSGFSLSAGGRLFARDEGISRVRKEKIFPPNFACELPRIPTMCTYEGGWCFFGFHLTSRESIIFIKFMKCGRLYGRQFKQFQRSHETI